MIRVYWLTLVPPPLGLMPWSAIRPMSRATLPGTSMTFAGLPPMSAIPRAAVVPYLYSKAPPLLSVPVAAPL